MRQEISEKITSMKTDIETIKKNKSKMKNTIAEMNTLEGINVG